MSVRDDLYRGKGWEGSTDLSLPMGVAVVSGMQPIGTMAATILVFTACRSRNGGDYYKYINCLLESMMTVNLFVAFFSVLAQENGGPAADKIHPDFFNRAFFPCVTRTLPQRIHRATIVRGFAVAGFRSQR